MFFAIYFALTFILAYWMYYFKFSYGINLLKEFVPSFVFWILPFVKASINHLNLRNNITELSDEAFQIIQNIKNPDNTELLGSEYVGYWEEYDKKDRVLFNEKISKKLKNQLIDNLNSVIDLNPNEFYYVMESRTLTEELSAKAKGITLNHNNPSDKKLIVFNWLTLPNSLTLKYKKALKEYERMKEKSSKKLREFNDDENALVTNYGVCPKCYKNISMLARKCPHCTADLG